MSSPVHRIDYRQHIASLDGLRGFAICLVFLHHYYPRQRFNPVSMLASAGWVGVDVFFVLSGFLITGILYETVGKPYSLRNFFARRSLRLLPLYLVVLTLIVLLAKPLQVPLGWTDALFFAYGANLSSAFGVMPDFGPYLRFNHLWSLAVEEQFYLLWAPLVFLLVTRKRIITACITGIALAILLRGAGVFLVSAHTIYQSLFTRMDSMLCGALMAMALRGAQGDAWLTHRRLYCALGVGLAILGGSFVYSRSFFNERLATQMVGYVGDDLWCTALLGLTLLPGTMINRWTNFAALRIMGRYSYGLYLLHEIPAPIFDRMLAKGESMFHPIWLSGTLSTFLLFCLCFTAAALSYHFIEVPCLRLKRYFSYSHPKGNASLAMDDSVDLRPTQTSI